MAPKVPALSRLAVIAQLPAEHGGPIIVRPWLRDLVAALDNPAVLLLLVCLIRQTGKSQAALAVAVSELLRPNSYTLFVSASLDQAETVFHRKLRGPLRKLLAALGVPAAAVRFTKRGVEVPALNSMLEIVAPNETTAPGRSPTLLIVDEGRDVPDEVFATIAPSVVGASGKILILGTPGKPAGFFYELVSHPPAEAWLYRSAENDNPHASASVLGFLRTKLGALFPALMRRELEGEFTQAGDTFLPARLVDAAVDDRLGETPSSDRPAFAFLDLSRKRDLTSLVVVTLERARRPEAADHVVVASVQTWDPTQSPTGETPFEEVRAVLRQLPVRFPHLKRLLVDEGAEAGSVLPWARTHPRLSTRVEGFVASATSNMDLWGALSARLHAGTLSLPRHDRLIAELKSLRQEAFAFGTRWRVVDANRRLHRDVSVALAGAVCAAGVARTCTSPLCVDETCTGVAPQMLLFTADSDAWDARHPSPEARADLAAAEAAVDAEMGALVGADETETGLGAQLAALATQGFATFAQTAAALRARRAARPPRPSREEWMRTYLTDQRTTRERAAEEAARQRAAADLAEKVRRGGGSWFPGDY